MFVPGWVGLNSVILCSWESTHTTLPLSKMSNITQFVSTWSKGMNKTASIYLWVSLPGKVYVIVYSDSPLSVEEGDTEPFYYHLGDAEEALTSAGYVRLG